MEKRNESKAADDAKNQYDTKDLHEDQREEDANKHPLISDLASI